MSNKKVYCIKISVNCVANDPVDIRCGGPNYLGFDFFVEEEKADDMQKFISSSLESFDIPLVSMYTDGKMTLDAQKVWTQERIVEEIEKESSYLQSEAQRNYNS